MPVLYKPFQSVLEDKNKKKLFHPRVIYTANVSTAQASLTVRFLPNYTKNPDRTTATRSLVTGAKCVRFDLADTSASGGGDSGKPDGGGSGSGGSGDGGGEAPDPAA